MALSPVRDRRPLAIAVAVGLLAIAGIVVVTSGDDPADRTDCVRLEVSSSTEKDDILRELAQDYDRAGREFGGRCAKVTVSGLTSGAAMEALSSGWAGADTGLPEPQVWVPSTSLWLSRLQSRGKSVQAPNTGNRSIAASQLVVAMPEMMAKVFLERYPDPGWDDIMRLATAPGGWASLGHPEWKQFSLGRDNPELSSSGLSASLATFHAAALSTGRSGIDPAALADPAVLRFVHDVESSVSRYTQDASEFVDLLRAEDSRDGVPPVSAIVMQEQLAYHYNNGKDRPQHPFQAIYPKDGSLPFDHPYIVLASASADQRAAADDFFAYLGETHARDRLRAEGFRDRESPTTPTTELRDKLRVPDRPTPPPMPIPEPRLIEEIVKLWNTTRRPARVLLVLDNSGSMTGSPNPSDTSLAGMRKGEMVKPAVRRALDLLSDRDEIGLWTFSSKPTEVVPVGPVPTTKAAITTAVDHPTLVGGTSLYTTIGSAYDQMIAAADPERINAIVVLSDGEDDSHKPPPDTLLAKIDPVRTERSLPIFTIAFGSDALGGKSALETIAATSRAKSYDAIKDPRNIEEVLDAVFRNF